MKHTGFCQTLYFNENILKAAVCTYFTTLDITILILIPLHFKPLFPFTLLPVFPFQTQVKTCFSALIISWDSLQIAKFVHAWHTSNIFFFSVRRETNLNFAFSIECSSHTHLRACLLSLIHILKAGYALYGSGLYPLVIPYLAYILSFFHMCLPVWGLCVKV